MKNFWLVRVSHHYDRARFFAFTPTFGRLDQLRLYQDPKYRFEVQTNPNRAVAVNVLLTSGKFVQYDENFHGFQRRLGAGVKLEVRVSQRAKVGAYTMFQVRRRRIPVRRDTCLDPAGVRPMACPSS